MTSSNNSRERVDLARSFCCDIFPVGRPVVVAIHKSGNHTSGNPAVRFRYYPQSAPGHFSRRVSGNWLARVMRHSSVRAPLASSFFPETGGTFLRGVVNSFGPFEAARRFLCTLRQLRQEARGVLTVLFRPAPSCALVHVEQHERRRLQCLTKVLKEPTK
jgi:hypothetical protein